MHSLWVQAAIHASFGGRAVPRWGEEIVVLIAGAACVREIIWENED